MVFSSFQFIYGFVPIVYGILYVILKFKQPKFAIAWLIAASLFFYAYWDPKYVAVILASMAINFVASPLVDPRARGEATTRRIWLTALIVANVGGLLYYKYTNLIVDTAAQITGVEIVIEKIVLPIGISFFTFQQIAFQVDRYRGLIKEIKLLDYALFVTYFPQLIAGPIVHHKEMMPQFDEGRGLRIDAGTLAFGVTYFFIGLAKKTLLADPLAVHADAVFNAAQRGVEISTADAWIGALAYTGQIYFDFAGYSAMAIGLAAMIGIRLPLNFYSPYKSLSIVEFWRRWHMTLSRFLRDYLYIPLGGNRKGVSRRYVNLAATMLIGGFWHGASWTFLFWGGLHGLYLCVNHAFDALTRGRAAPTGATRLALRGGAWLITMSAVVVAWVFFRSESFGAAFEILGAGFGFDADGAARLVRLGPGDLALFALAFGLATLAPNAAQFMRYQDRSSIDIEPARRLAWSARRRWAPVLGILAMLATLAIQRNNEFIYFQF